MERETSSLLHGCQPSTAGVSGTVEDVCVVGINISSDIKDYILILSEIFFLWAAIFKLNNWP